MQVELWRGQVCRICRVEGREGVDLSYPCKCSGSIKYVHEKCLNEWLGVSRSKRPCSRCENHVAKCEICGHMMSFRPQFSVSVIYQMVDTLKNNAAKAFRANSNVAKLFGDLSRPFNTTTQMFRVHALYSSGIWQTIAEFTVESGALHNRGTFSQFYAYFALNFIGAHILLSSFCALSLLCLQMYRDCDGRRRQDRCLPPARHSNIPVSLFQTPTYWGYSVGMLKTIETIAAVHSWLQRWTMLLGRWFLHRLRYQHALRLLFDQLAVELAQYGFCRWVVSELLRYDADALEADGVTVEGVLSVLVKAAAEVALGWSARTVSALLCFALYFCTQVGCTAERVSNPASVMVKVFARDLLPTTCKVAVQVLVLLVLLPGAVACALEYELQLYLPALLMDTTRVVPRALLVLALFCLASRLLGFCDALAAETYSSVVPDAVPAFPRLTTAEALVQNARLPWADLLITCVVTALASALLGAISVVLPVRLILALLGEPQSVIQVGYQVTVLGAEFSLWHMCIWLSVPVLLSAYELGKGIFLIVPAAVARYLTEQTACLPPVCPLAPGLNTATAVCGWWACAVLVALPVLAGLGGLFTLLLGVPLLLGRAFLSLLPAPSSAHPLFLFAVGLPLLATLLCCARASDSEGGGWYSIGATAAVQFCRACLLGTAVLAGPCMVLGWLLCVLLVEGGKLRGDIPLQQVIAYTPGGCALGGSFALSCYMCAQMCAGSGDVKDATVQAPRTARAVLGAIPSLAVLMLDLTLPSFFLAGRFLLAGRPIVYRLLAWLPSYLMLRGLLYLCGVYRAACRRKVVVGYKLMNVDEVHAH